MNACSIEVILSHVEVDTWLECDVELFQLWMIGIALFLRICLYLADGEPHFYASAATADDWTTTFLLFD